MSPRLWQLANRGQFVLMFDGEPTVEQCNKQLTIEILTAMKEREWLLGYGTLFWIAEGKKPVQKAEGRVMIHRERACKKTTCGSIKTCGATKVRWDVYTEFGYWRWNRLDKIVYHDKNDGYEDSPQWLPDEEGNLLYIQDVVGGRYVMQILTDGRAID